MQVKDIIEGLGDFLLSTFEILPVLGNLPNFIFLAIGSVLFLYWMGQMRKHAQAGEK
jgi:hypothetical protein